MKKVSALLVALALLCVLPACSKSAKNLAAGKVAPDFRLNDLTGRTIYLNAELRKQPVVLTFFATWCEPCRKEAPLLISLHKQLGDQAEIICIAVDPENADKIRSFASGLAVPYPMLLDEGRKVMDQYKVEDLPATFLIGKDSRIYSRFTRFGSEEAKALVNEVKRLTKGE